jgi:hypothetical protein
MEHGKTIALDSAPAFSHRFILRRDGVYCLNSIDTDPFIVYPAKKVNARLILGLLLLLVIHFFGI